MNAKISVFFICVEAIIYLLLYNLHDCTFNSLNYKKEFIRRILKKIKKGENELLFWYSMRGFFVPEELFLTTPLRELRLLNCHYWDISGALSMF